LLLSAVLSGARLLPLSIDNRLPRSAQQQTRRTLRQRSIDGTDGQTDGQTDTVPLHRPCRTLGEQWQLQVATADR